jgi:hypothetical protein
MVARGTAGHATRDGCQPAGSCRARSYAAGQRPGFLDVTQPRSAANLYLMRICTKAAVSELAATAQSQDQWDTVPLLQRAATVSTPRRRLFAWSAHAAHGVQKVCSWPCQEFLPASSVVQAPTRQAEASAPRHPTAEAGLPHPTWTTWTPCCLPALLSAVRRHGSIGQMSMHPLPGSCLLPAQVAAAARRQATVTAGPPRPTWTTWTPCWPTQATTSRSLSRPSAR